MKTTTSELAWEGVVTAGGWTAKIVTVVYWLTAASQVLCVVVVVQASEGTLHATDAVLPMTIPPTSHCKVRIISLHRVLFQLNSNQHYCLFITYLFTLNTHLPLLLCWLVWVYQVACPQYFRSRIFVQGGTSGVFILMVGEHSISSSISVQSQKNKRIRVYALNIECCVK